jgi:hypothetical protein
MSDGNLADRAERLHCRHFKKLSKMQKEINYDILENTLYVPSYYKVSKQFDDEIKLVWPNAPNDCYANIEKRGNNNTGTDSAMTVYESDPFQHRVNQDSTRYIHKYKYGDCEHTEHQPFANVTRRR